MDTIPRLTFLSWHKDRVTVVSSSRELRSRPWPKDSPSSRTKLNTRTHTHTNREVGMSTNETCRYRVCGRGWCTWAGCRWEVWTEWSPYWSAPSLDLPRPDTRGGTPRRWLALTGSRHRRLKADGENQCNTNTNTGPYSTAVWVQPTFTEVTDVFWELQMCTAQWGGEQANGLQEGCEEGRDLIKHRVPEQLGRGRPGTHTNTRRTCAHQQLSCVETRSVPNQVLLLEIFWSHCSVAACWNRVWHGCLGNQIANVLWQDMRLCLPLEWKKGQAFP